MKKTETKEVTEAVEEVAKPSEKEARAVAKYLRISPRKLRLVIDQVREKPLFQAIPALMVLKNKGARMTEKVLKSAMANAKQMGLDEQRLFISEIKADGGPVFKRFRPRSMGRADRILKRTSHLSLKLKEGNRFAKQIKTVVAAEEDLGDTKKVKKTKKAAAAS